MNFIPKVNESTYYLGVNDRSKPLFENLWPLPKGVSYNSYLIKDEKNVLIDAVDICYAQRFFSLLETALDGEQLDYLIINHMEPDHSGSIELLRTKYPDVKIVGNKKTLSMLEGYFGITEGVVEVGEDTPLKIGAERELSFVLAPMVHWPEVMFTYDKSEKTLYSIDAFGSFGTVDGGIFDEQIDHHDNLDEAYRYYSNIVGKYGSFTQKALQKASTLEIETICPSHGPVWRKYVKEIIEVYDKLSRYEGDPGVVVIVGSMYGNTEEYAELVGRSLGAHGVKRVKIHHLAKSHPSYIIADVFRYNGLIIGSPTYNNELWPPVESILRQLVSRNIPSRYFATFGSGSWNPNVSRHFDALLEKQKWERVGESIQFKMHMSEQDGAAAWKLGEEMAQAVLSKK
ncbi:MAG: FprA family A-type flavoprotein [Porphyromonas sp.]|nr:FprA family A-type flavoprotein [Porphyromonas sp.]